MPLYLYATIEGDRELSRRFNNIPVQLDNLKVPLSTIEREVMQSVDVNYSARGGLFGIWPKRKDNKSHPLLEKTGAMRSAFKSAVGDQYVSIFNPTSYFKYHQSNKPRRKLPRRVMLKIDEIRKVFIVKTFQRHIQETLRGQ